MISRLLDVYFLNFNYIGAFKIKIINSSISNRNTKVFHFAQWDFSTTSIP